MPVNFLLVESLRRFHSYYGAGYTIEYPSGSGQKLTLNEVADYLSRRLIEIFRRSPDGRRAVFGECAKFQTDPHFRDLIPFQSISMATPVAASVPGTKPVGPPLSQI